MCLVNGRPGTIRESLEQTKPIVPIDPWIRRCNEPASTESIYEQDQQREKPIEYETRPYYCSLSSTSDDCLSQQQRQPLLNIIDKDIEYVESRLRGQTTVSLPNSHSTNYTRDITWRQPPNHNLSSNDQQQSRLVHQTTNKQQLKETAGSIKSTSMTGQKSQNTECVKTVKRRIEKMNVYFSFNSFLSQLQCYSNCLHRHMASL
jgi:hypothetical protein